MKKILIFLVVSAILLAGVSFYNKGVFNSDRSIDQTGSVAMMVDKAVRVMSGWEHGMKACQLLLVSFLKTQGTGMTQATQSVWRELRQARFDHPDEMARNLQKRLHGDFFGLEQASMDKVQEREVQQTLRMITEQDFWHQMGFSGKLPQERFRNFPPH